VNNALRTLLAPTAETSSIVIIDLYLSRPTGTNAVYYFHCDSGNQYGKVGQTAAHVQGHENLAFVALTMLMRPAEPNTWSIASTWS